MRTGKKAIVITIVLLFVGVMVVQAGSVSYGGSVTDTSPCYHDWAGWFPYDAHVFTASVSGEYTLTVNTYTWAAVPWLYIVTSPFVDDDIMTYEVDSGNTPLTVTLTAGHKYAAVLGPDSGAPDEGACHTQQGAYSATITGPEGFPVEAVEEPVPGCDVLIPIPSTAVGATITTDTLAYWAPGQTTNTVLPAGTNVRAIAQEDGYYEILYVCDFLYVPVGTIGPNYESPWNGAPLP